MSVKPDGDGRINPAAAFGYGGMTLRDYFAGRVIGRMAAAMSDNGRFRDGGTASLAAEYSYRVADAMLAEREK